MLYKIPLLNCQEFILFDQTTFEWLTSEPSLARVDFINNLEYNSMGNILFKKKGANKILLVELLLKEFFKPFSPSLTKENLSHLNGNQFDFRLENLEYKIEFKRVRQRG